ncbi:hypothetical protein Hanom_Chr01g00019941 [Helianthus anomalus]
MGVEKRRQQTAMSGPQPPVVAYCHYFCRATHRFQLDTCEVSSLDEWSPNSWAYH